MSSIPEEHRKMALGILFCPAEERVARELQNLPKEDREQVWADMTGNPENTYYRLHAESPEFLYDSIQTLHAVLDTQQLHDPKSQFAYRQAMEQDSLYVDRQKIKFLRTDDFDSSAAALRLIKHFEMKKELFGIDKLGRDIRLEDFSNDDMESLLAGGVQLLPKPDHGGRPVIFTRAANYLYKDHKNMVRLCVHLCLAVYENRHNQTDLCLSVSLFEGCFFLIPFWF